jgi:hypothetical protein
MKTVELYVRVRHAVLIEGISERELPGPTFMPPYVRSSRQGGGNLLHVPSERPMVFQVVLNE